jgi:hypothetical protein
MEHLELVLDGGGDRPDLAAEEEGREDQGHSTCAGQINNSTDDKKPYHGANLGCIDSLRFAFQFFKRGNQKSSASATGERGQSECTLMNTVASVWGGAAPAEANGPLLAHLDNMIDADGFVHQARHAFHLMRAAVGEKLLNGGNLVDGSKYVVVPVLVSAVDVYDAVFNDVSFLRTERFVKIASCDSYQPGARVTRRFVTYAFRTLRQWAEFIGCRGAWARKHKFRPNTSALCIPNKAVKPGGCFSVDDARWAFFVSAGLQPLALNREIPGAGDVLRSRIGRAAASAVRDVKVFLLDSTELTFGDDSFVAYLAFVRPGYSEGPPEVKSIALNSGTESPFLVNGHFGWVPSDVLSWDTLTAGLVSITFAETMINDQPNLNFEPPKLKFRSLLLNEAGNMGL